MSTDSKTNQVEPDSKPKASPLQVDRYRSVKAFHEEFGFKTHLPLHKEGIGQRGVVNGTKINASQMLVGLSTTLAEAAQRLLQFALPFQQVGDNRIYRAHLMIEELSEALMALGERDEVSLADALADLSYVIEGTAVTYNIPLNVVFAEVHRSNMSKTRDADDPRMKAKDPERGYTPPNIIGSIESGREELGNDEL